MNVANISYTVQYYSIKNDTNSSRTLIDSLTRVIFVNWLIVVFYFFLKSMIMKHYIFQT